MTLKLKLYDSAIDTSKTLSISNANSEVSTAQLTSFVNSYNQIYDFNFSLVTATISEVTDTVIYPEP